MSDSNWNHRRALAVANASGSAGKSTTVVTLAALLAEQGRSVLVVDGDAQATATEWFGVDAADQPTIGDLLMKRAPLEAVVTDTNTAGVRIVPASRGLDADVIALTSAAAGEQRLKTALRTAAADVILIDCPGAINALTISALVVADAVLTVTQPTLKEMKGISELEDTINDLAEAYNPDLALAGVVPCIVPSGPGQLYSDAMSLLARDYAGLVTPSVRRAIRVPEAHAQALPLPAHAPRAEVTEDYRKVLAWLTDRGVL